MSTTAKQKNSAAAANNKIIIDPVTRIEGHLRIEVEMTGGKVSNAYSSITLFRGLELILKGRDPRDAQHITQRACGVCTYTHSLAATRAVEAAVGVKIPPNAAYIRNLMLGTQILHDHIVHFYHLHALDFVDVSNAVKADPVKAAKIAESAYPGKITAESLKAVQDRLKGYFDAGQLGIFSNAYFLGGHPSYRLSPELDLIATAHYLEALHLQVKLARAMAVFGGKNPHPQFLLVGGVACYDALTPERIKEFRDLITDSVRFVNDVYLPDVLTIASQYKEVAGYGSTPNFMTFEDFHNPLNPAGDPFLHSGLLLNKDLNNIHEFDKNQIHEHVRHSWYKGAEARDPFHGATEPLYTDLHGDDRYTWSKAPRYMDMPMETGPLAGVLVSYARKHPQVVPIVNTVLGKLGIGIQDMNSTLGRTAARCIQAVLIASQLESWLNAYEENVKKGDNILVAKYEMPKSGEGVGFVLAPRGGLSHWICIENGKIDNYQMVVPSTWNLGPRCAKNLLGPVETALMNNPVADPKRPVELLRTVHSYDPCIACAVHVIDADTNEKRVFKIL